MLISKLKFKIILLMVLVFLINGCIQQNQEIKKVSDKVECNIDFDCSKAGCSGEICTTKEEAQQIVTLCIILPKYICYKLTTCACINNMCKWKGTEEFNKCIKNYT